LDALSFDLVGVKTVRDYNREMKRRTRQLKERERVFRSYQRTHAFPKCRIESKLASPPFSLMVADAWQSIDLTSPELVSDGLREYLRCVRREGHVRAAVRLMEQFREITNTEASRLRFLTRPAFELGQLLLDRLLSVDSTVFPTNDVEVHFHGNDIVLALSSMFQRSTTGGPVFHSRKRLTLDYEGKTYVLAFSKHAIDAVCDRFKPDYKTVHQLSQYSIYVLDQGLGSMTTM
jgi:hypothetical protein